MPDGGMDRNIAVMDFGASSTTFSVLRDLKVTYTRDFAFGGRELESLLSERTKLVILNFPSNPTAQCVDLPFFEHVVAVARDAKALEAKPPKAPRRAAPRPRRPRSSAPSSLRSPERSTAPRSAPSSSRARRSCSRPGCLPSRATS